MFNFALIGNPVNHSLSPIVHERFASMLGQKISYNLYELELPAIADWLVDFAKYGHGFNVTAPYKSDILKHVDVIGSSAYHVGVANSVACKNGFFAESFDGLGFYLAIKRLGYKVRGQDILILGAGSVVHSILPYILLLKPRSVVIAVRAVEKAQSSFADYLSGTIKVDCIKAVDRSFAGVVQASSAYVHKALLPLNAKWFHEDTWVMDLNYGDSFSLFKEQILGFGCSRLCDGKLMLVEQAAQSYKHWTGVLPLVSEYLKQYELP